MSDFYPDWAARLIDLNDQEEAITAFLAMARIDAGQSDEIHPTIRVKNYSAPAAHPYRMRFDLRAPDPLNEKEGDQDHVLFKTKDDTHGRSRKGQRRSEDYQADRAVRIGFIPWVATQPRFVFRDRRQATRVIYLDRTGPDEYFAVVMEELAGIPRFNFITAYAMTVKEFEQSRTKWKRLYPSDPKPPKKKRKG